MNYQETVTEKTSIKLGFFYSLGEVGCQFSWNMINTYLTLFYTDIVGLTGTAISFIMLVARIWDAANDPMMGIVADRTHTRWGKFRPYLMFASPVLAIFNVLTFTVMPVTGVLKILLCLVFYIGAGMAYTALCITYGGLVNLIARDSQVRMNYTSARAIGSSAVSMLLSAVAMPMILYFSKSDTANARGYFWTTVIFSVAMLPCLWLCAWQCKETVIVKSSAEVKKPKKSVSESLKLMCKNKMLLITVFCVFMGAVSVIGRMSLLTYYVIYVVGSYTMIAPIFTSMTVMQLFGSFLLPWATKIFGKRNWLVILNCVQMAAFVVMFLLPANNNVFLIGISMVIGITNSSSNICTGMLSDCIEYGDWKYKIREEGLTYSFMSFGVKLASALAGSVGVLLLEAVGYVAGAEQTAGAKMGINAVVNLLPAACVLLCTIPLFFYKLDAKKMTEIREDLDKREKQTASEAQTI